MQSAKGDTIIGSSGTKLTQEETISVLIVDDAPIIRKIHKMFLNKLGVKLVQEAQTGKEAVDLHLKGYSFDLILMDKEMPIMDGATATRVLRSFGVKSMIVGVTAVTMESELESFKDAGLDYCCVKPLQAQQLIPIHQELLAKKYPRT